MTHFTTGTNQSENKHEYAVGLALHKTAQSCVNFELLPSPEDFAGFRLSV